MVDSQKTKQYLTSLNIYQSAELTQILAAKAAQGADLSSEIIEGEARNLFERDCLEECLDKEIYDYENASACLKRNSDYKERTVIPELAEDISAFRKGLEGGKPSLEDAIKELDSVSMNYFRYSRG